MLQSLNLHVLVVIFLSLETPMLSTSGFETSITDSHGPSSESTFTMSSEFSVHPSSPERKYMQSRANFMSKASLSRLMLNVFTRQNPQASFLTRPALVAVLHSVRLLQLLNRMQAQASTPSGHPA